MLDMKKLIAKLLADKVLLDCTVNLANPTVMTDQGSTAKALHLMGDTYLVFFVALVKTSSQRSNMAMVSFDVDGQRLTAYLPWYFLGRMDSASALSYCFGNNSGGWINASGTWSANTIYRISGVGLFKTS